VGGLHRFDAVAPGQSQRGPRLGRRRRDRQGAAADRGAGIRRQPRWSPDGKTLAFISTREGGAQVWLLPIAGGDAHKVSSLGDGASDPVWLPDGSGLLVVSDIKWPANQEIDQRNGAYPTEARIWTGLMWRHWTISARANGSICSASMSQPGKRRT